MSSGGMEWAYRMIAAHDLDPLGGMIVLHLGWRDAPSLRTDRGIARALSQHRSSVCKATAKLAALGVIARRSGQWVAVETIKIVEQAPDAPRPSRDCSDDLSGVDHSVGRQGVDHSVGRGGPLSGPAKDHSVGHMRKEKIREGARVPSRSAGRSASSRVETSRPASSGAGGSASVDPSSLTEFQRSRIRSEQSVIVAGALVAAGSPEMRALRQVAGLR